MGFLTPILFYNDHIHEAKSNTTIGKDLYMACIKGKDGDFSISRFRKTWLDKLLEKFGLYRKPTNKNYKGCSSFAQVLRCKHADDFRLIGVLGNTWIDLSDQAYLSKDALQYVGTPISNKEYLQQLIKYAKKDIKVLEAKLKEEKNETTNSNT